MVNPLPTYHVVSAEGVRIRLANGQELIDGMSSWWCAIHGYNHPVMNEAIHAQLLQISHVMFGGLTHDAAVRLGQLLLKVTPPTLKRIFFCDSGSVAVEVAIKMSFQYWKALGQSRKHRLLTIRGGYHGDTFGAMAVCDPFTGMHERFQNVLPKHIFVDRPLSRFDDVLSPEDETRIRHAFEQHHNELAAVILEPIVQGAGGMWFYSPHYLKRVRKLCNEYDVLLIFDEIATGFGRTGKFFACEHASSVEPDILCIGKAMTGGYLSQAATLTSDRIARDISADGSVLMHGPTFMANPLACASSISSIQLLLNGPWQDQVKSIEEQLRSELGRYKTHAAVSDVRVLGAIGVVQTQKPVPVVDIQKIFVRAGVWIRPFQDLIYVMPPYVINVQDLRTLTDAIGLGLDAL